LLLGLSLDRVTPFGLSILDKMLSPKPADEYVWNEENEYTWGDLAWHRGIWYQYQPDVDTFPYPVAPTTAPNIAEMSYYSYNPEKPTEKESRNFRVWVMIDPRTLNISIDSAAKSGYEFSFADKSAAAIRRVPGLTDGYEGFERPSTYNFTSKVGTVLPELEYVNSSAPTIIYKNTKFSWFGQRTTIGESIEMVSEGGLTDTGPMCSASIPETFSSEGTYVAGQSKAPILVIGDAFYDDEAMQESTLNNYEYSRSQSINLPRRLFSEPPPSDIDISRLAIALFPREYDPGIVACFGRKIDLKLKALTVTLEAYSYKTPFIETPEDEDIVAYRPSGGSVEMIEPAGDGILTERLYKVVGPFDEAVWETLDEKVLTVQSTYDAYNGVNRSEETLEGTLSYKQYIGGGIYWKPQDSTFLT